MSGRPFIVACIPAFNEERSIARVVIEAQRYVDKVVVCDDGSTDLTGVIAERLGAVVVRHERNMGYGAALRSLFLKAREMGADVMVTLDADGQHDPNYIPKLVEPILNGEADIVIGSRFLGGGRGVPRYRKWGIKVITWLVRWVSYRELTDAQSGFRAYGRRALEAITPVERGMGVSTEILLKAKDNGLRIKELPIKVNYDVENSSTCSPLYHGLSVVLSTVKYWSMRHPLILYGILGLVALVVAMIFWVWTFKIFAATRQVITNITLVAIGATMVGLMLLTTAVILWVLVSVVREIRWCYG